MIDHAPRIRAEEKQADDQSAIDELERRAAPLQWALIIAVAVISAAGLADQASSFAAHYMDLSIANEKLVQCMNGGLINVGGVFVSCNEHSSTIIAQVQP